MAPGELTSFQSTVLVTYPTHRKGGKPVTGESYMESRRYDDGAEGLWRVHDGLYDLTDFVSQHPGGRHWLQTTKGTDITEAFESHHISERAAKLLPKFFVREANQPRNSPYTFHENGFYKTFKRRAALVLDSTPDASFSRHFNDGLVAACFVILVAAAALGSYFLATVGAFIISITAICAHNFTHMRDNWRMYYLSLCFLSLEEWRVSHILSHHLYPNTQLDMEISMLEPLLEYFPTRTKKTMKKLDAILAFTVSACIMLPSKIPHRLDRDFGLGQLDATRDRLDYGSNPVLVLSRYGDHALHHLLPTVDHCRLRALYPVFFKTLADFGIEYRFTTAWMLFKGSFKQLIRSECNPLAPGSVIELKN